jgi:hypothetical protein
MGGGDSYHPHGHHTFKGLVAAAECRCGRARAQQRSKGVPAVLFCRGLEPVWWLVVRSQGMEA